MSVRTAALRRRKMADRSLGEDIGSSHHSSRSLAPASHEVNRTGRTTVSLLEPWWWCVLGTAPLPLAHARNDNRAPQAPGCFRDQIPSTPVAVRPPRSPRLAERFWLAAAPDARQVEAVSRARQPPHDAPSDRGVDRLLPLDQWFCSRVRLLCRHTPRATRRRSSPKATWRRTARCE